MEEVAVAQDDLIAMPPSATTGLLGGLAQFNCKIAFGTSTKTMTWEYNNKTIYSFLYGVEDYPTKDTNKYYVKRDKDTFNLTVNDLRYEDERIYACHGFTQQASATLIVLGEPLLIPPPVTPVKGEIAVFICEAKFGGPGKDEIEGLPHLRMLIDDTILKNSSEMSRLRVSGHVYKLQQAQNITVDASLHGKQLTCELGTSSTGTNYTAHLIMNVHYPVRNIRYSPRNDSYEFGSQISCSADGNPNPSFEWRNLAVPERVYKGSFLNITEDMTGENEWMCTTKNLISDTIYEERVIATFEIRATDNNRTSAGNSKPDNTMNIATGIIIGLLLVIAVILGLITANFIQKNHTRRQVIYPLERHLSVSQRSMKSNLESQGEIKLTNFNTNEKAEINPKMHGSSEKEIHTEDSAMNSVFSSPNLVNNAGYFARIKRQHSLEEL